jgi:hypothetical protein
MSLTKRLFLASDAGIYGVFPARLDFCSRLLLLFHFCVLWSCAGCLRCYLFVLPRWSIVFRNGFPFLSLDLLGIAFVFLEFTNDIFTSTQNSFLGALPSGRLWRSFLRRNRLAGQWDWYLQRFPFAHRFLFESAVFFALVLSTSAGVLRPLLFLFSALTDNYVVGFNFCLYCNEEMSRTACVFFLVADDIRTVFVLFNFRRPLPGFFTLQT